MCARALFHCWPERKRLTRYVRLSCVKLDVDETEQKEELEMCAIRYHLFYFKVIVW